MSEQQRFPVLIRGTEGEPERLENWPQILNEAVLSINSQGLQTPWCQGKSENGTEQILIYGLQAQEP